MGDSGGGGPIYVMEDGSSNDQSAALSGKLVTAAAMFFLLTVIFVVLLYLYTRWRWGRRSTSAAAEAYRISRFDIEGTEVITRLHGLDPDVIRSLPVVVFGTKDFKDGIECAVCLSELVEGEKARVLPKCNHGFHLECIDMWFYSHSTCPLCRNPVGGHLEMIGSDVPTDGPSSSSSLENSSLPTNVLFWGTGTGLVQETHSSSTPPPPTCTTDRMLVIDIPRRVISEVSLMASSPLSPSSSKTPTPTSTRLRSLKRLFFTTPK